MNITDILIHVHPTLAAGQRAKIEEALGGFVVSPNLWRPIMAEGKTVLILGGGIGGVAASQMCAG